MIRMKSFKLYLFISFYFGKNIVSYNLNLKLNLN